MTRWVLGLGGSDHDGSAALMCGNDIRVAVEEERLTRRKHGASHFFQNPVQESVDYCLAECGCLLEDVDIVSSDLLPARVRFEFQGTPLRLYPHHLCHAAAAYLMLPPRERAGVIVYDGMGSIQDRTPDVPARNVRETFTFYVIDDGEVECLGQTVGTGVWEHDDFPSSVNNSVGMFYELITALLGFGVLESGKTMGLAAHGEPRYLPLLEQFVAYGESPRDAFRCELDSPRLRTVLEEVLHADRGSFAVKADLAASAQAVVNNSLVRASTFFIDQKIDVLCVSGGCALNTVANSFLVDHSPLSVPIVVPPHSGDAGLGLGALWLAAREGGYKEVLFRGGPAAPGIARPGRVYPPESVLNAVRQYYPRLAHDASVRSADDLAVELAAGRIIGLFNGRSEIGPRALGGRSILADPRRIAMRERLNREIKGREPFRPLAPMILSERFNEFFTDDRHLDSFMLKVAVATKRCRREAPAVVHVDGTARVQAVGPEDDPFLRQLLAAFEHLTGLPLLLNTSFNRRGEPIVETPLDAVDAFLGMKLDGLYLDDLFYRQVAAESPSSRVI